MKPIPAIVRLREQLIVYWGARTEKERKYLIVGAGIAAGALVYALFIEPAWTGKARLERELPQLRQEAAELQAMAQEAAMLKGQVVPPPTPMTRDALAASLAARAITPASLTVAGESAKLQVSNVSFANLYSWLDAQRREHRITVADGTVTALPALGQVDATLTLSQRRDDGAGAAP
jgi:general secretion pathway protein M